MNEYYVAIRVDNNKEWIDTTTIALLADEAKKKQISQIGKFHDGQ